MAKKKIHKLIVRAFWISLIFCIGFTWFYMKRVIPDKLNIVAAEEEQFHFSMPFDVTLHSDSEEVVLGNGSNIPSDKIHLQVNQPFSLYSKNLGSYKLGLKLFGWIQLKDIQVNVVDTKYAIPCGTPVGIYLKSNGVMVIGTGDVTKKDGMVVEPAFGVLQSGDYLEAINGIPLSDKETLMNELNKTGGSEAVLKVRRGNENIDVKMNPIETEDGSYKLGVWVRDDTQGIGTMTYVDMNGQFGALGHGISDSDTGNVVQITEGSLYETAILGIEKGTFGKPGVMSGIIYYGPGSNLGTIKANTEEGIFGTVNERFKQSISQDALPIGYRQDVEKGKAYIRSDVSGKVRDYEIEIQRVDYSTTHKSKGMVIKVTDPDLLALTGGIVQGMSGSPIIQDGKLIGAVTHVFIQDSTRGYGIFIENMVNH
ncbi:MULTISPECIES: SpoIVB peptidase [Lacrimispora]|jgi:stage IV sporulation protein B|uniref:SpoIVB peptidase n=1 Tax=Lacrimispora TaxID=2719231 RepID=UPI000BE291A6|nr:SpoIVB peptidase [Lacrimispora amygdalina]MDK2968268.1 stage sporulation protein [Lacrimispora sp.]